MRERECAQVHSTKQRQSKRQYEVGHASFRFLKNGFKKTTTTTTTKKKHFSLLLNTPKKLMAEFAVATPVQKNPMRKVQNGSHLTGQ